jgi:hypothetical protein
LIVINGYEVFFSEEYQMWGVRRDGTYTEASTVYCSTQAEAVGLAEVGLAREIGGGELEL